MEWEEQESMPVLSNEDMTLEEITTGNTLPEIPDDALEVFITDFAPQPASEAAASSLTSSVIGPGQIPFQGQNHEVIPSNLKPGPTANNGYDSDDALEDIISILDFVSLSTSKVEASSSTSGTTLPDQTPFQGGQSHEVWQLFLEPGPAANFGHGLDASNQYHKEHSYVNWNDTLSNGYIIARAQPGEAPPDSCEAQWGKAPPESGEARAEPDDPQPGPSDQQPEPDEAQRKRCGVRQGEKKAEPREALPGRTNLHELLELEEGSLYSYACLLCRLLFTFKPNLERQTKVFHVGTICIICGDSFTYECIARHSAIVRPKIMYDCHLCEIGFSTKIHFEQHMFQMHAMKNHVCETCNLSYTSKCSLRKHQKAKHEGKGNLERHDSEKANRPEKKKPVACSKCKKGFANKSNLIRHWKRAHSKIRPFLCSKCPKAFGQQNLLIEHMGVHCDERPFNCSFGTCEKTFKQKAGLKQHLKHVHGQATNLPVGQDSSI